MTVLTLIARIASLIMSTVAIILVILDFIITKKLKKVVNKDNIENIIKVTRKDGSVRYVVVFLDENDNKWRIVNITKNHNHICKCRFDSKKDAIYDIEINDNVKEWKYIN